LFKGERGTGQISRVQGGGISVSDARTQELRSQELQEFRRKAPNPKERYSLAKAIEYV
jgi:hypothetical protein